MMVGEIGLYRLKLFALKVCFYFFTKNLKTYCSALEFILLRRCVLFVLSFSTEATLLTFVFIAQYYSI